MAASSSTRASRAARQDPGEHLGRPGVEGPSDRVHGAATCRGDHAPARRGGDRPVPDAKVGMTSDRPRLDLRHPHLEKGQLAPLGSGFGRPTGPATTTRRPTTRVGGANDMTCGERVGAGTRTATVNVPSGAAHTSTSWNPSQRPVTGARPCRRPLDREQGPWSTASAGSSASSSATRSSRGSCTPGGTEDAAACVLDVDAERHTTPANATRPRSARRCAIRLRHARGHSGSPRVAPQDRDAGQAELGQGPGVRARGPSPCCTRRRSDAPATTSPSAASDDSRQRADRRSHHRTRGSKRPQERSFDVRAGDPTESDRLRRRHNSRTDRNLRRRRSFTCMRAIGGGGGRPPPPPSDRATRATRCPPRLVIARGDALTTLDPERRRRWLTTTRPTTTSGPDHRRNGRARPSKRPEGVEEARQVTSRHRAVGTVAPPTPPQHLRHHRLPGERRRVARRRATVRSHRRATPPQRPTATLATCAPTTRCD